MQEFADTVKEGLQVADWMTRREVVRAVVKRVEIGEENVRASGKS